MGVYFADPGKAIQNAINISVTLKIDVRPKERPKIAHIGSESGRRPPTKALQLHIRPSIENMEEKVHRQNMLPINIAHEHQRTESLNTVATKRQVFASIYIYIYIYIDGRLFCRPWKGDPESDQDFGAFKD